MKKILIISYFFPPCNITAADRPKSFAENFKKHGLFPVVVTRHWNGDETGSSAEFARSNEKPPEITENEFYRLIRLPYFAEENVFQRIEPIRRFANFINTITGNFAAQENTSRAFYGFLKNYLKENPVDAVLVISSPLNVIRLGHRLSAEFDVPLIADFRDLWDNNLLSENYRPKLETRVKNFFYEFHLKKWLGGAALITSVSEPLVAELKRLIPTAKTFVVMNGFDGETVRIATESVNQKNSKFVFSVVGTLYPQQNLSILIEGLKLFLRDKNSNEIELNFIGTAAFAQVKSLLENNLPKESTIVTDRISPAEARAQTIRSHVLFYAGWSGYKGIVSAKIFEYLGAGRNILIAPSDRDIIARIVTETEAGKTADSPAEFAAILNFWFGEWKAGGNLIYRGKPEKIRFYSRENQAARFAAEIQKTINRSG